jgi:hypothetical protein
MGSTAPLIITTIGLLSSQPQLALLTAIAAARLKGSNFSSGAVITCDHPSRSAMIKLIIALALPRLVCRYAAKADCEIVIKPERLVERFKNFPS